MHRCWEGLGESDPQTTEDDHTQDLIKNGAVVTPLGGQELAFYHILPCVVPGQGCKSRSYHPGAPYQALTDIPVKYFFFLHVACDGWDYQGNIHALLSFCSLEGTR